MTKTDFVKSSDALFCEQLGKMASNIDTYKTILGITDEEVDEIKLDYKGFTFVLNTLKDVPEFGKSWTSYKDNLRKSKTEVASVFPVFTLPENPAPAPLANGLEMRFRELAKKMKAHAGYTDAIGQQLGIVADSVAPPNTEEAKAIIKQLKVTGGKVLLKWTKGPFDGINIYRKRGNGAFEFVGFDMSPDWTDNTPLPATFENWTYRIIYVRKDVEVGHFSNEVSVGVVAAV